MNISMRWGVASRPGSREFQTFDASPRWKNWRNQHATKEWTATSDTASIINTSETAYVVLKLSPISPTGMVQTRARLWVRHRSAEGPTLRHRHANPIYFPLCDQAIGLTGFLVSGLELGCMGIFAACATPRRSLPTP
jgi:hypothetical protein